MKNNQARTENQNKLNRSAAQFNTARLLRKNPTMQKWGEDELYFFAESIDTARELPVHECLKFLRGMCKVAGDTEWIDGLRAVVIAMNTCNDQLDLLQIGVDPTTPETN